MVRKAARKFTLEFKRQVVSLVLEESLTHTEVAKRLDLSAALVGRWVKEFGKDGESAFPGKGHQTPEQEEIRKLKQELHRVTLERDILKKTIGLFTVPLK
jgi:transposase